MTAISTSDVDRIAEAVAEKLKNSHACRFTDEEAKLVHVLRNNLDRESMIILGWVGRSAKTMGVWVTRLFFVGVFLALAAGLVVAVKLGWVNLGNLKLQTP